MAERVSGGEEQTTGVVGVGDDAAVALAMSECLAENVVCEGFGGAVGIGDACDAVAAVADEGCRAAEGIGVGEWGAEGVVGERFGGTVGIGYRGDLPCGRVGVGGDTPERIFLCGKIAGIGVEGVGGGVAVTVILSSDGGGSFFVGAVVLDDFATVGEGNHWLVELIVEKADAEDFAAGFDVDL